MLRRIEDAEIRGVAESALERTRWSLDLDNDGLCHGELGNVETLLVASEALSLNRTLSSLVTERAKLIVHNIATRGWRSARPGHVEVPGLMTGLAGIGFELLRLADASRTPSVLLLQAPKSQPHSVEL